MYIYIYFLIITIYIYILFSLIINAASHVGKSQNVSQTAIREPIALIAHVGPSAPIKGSRGHTGPPISLGFQSERGGGWGVGGNEENTRKNRECALKHCSQSQSCLRLF